MVAGSLPSQEYLRECFVYDEVRGYLVWRKRECASNQWNSRWAGKPAFTARNGMGYLHGHLDSFDYLAHRIIWKLVKGYDPIHVDHVNGDKTDNRISNLRSVSQQTNQRNQKLPKTNTSGIIGVSWSQRRCNWRARISVGGKDKALGSFKDFESAVAARKKAERELGFHPNHGRVAA